MINLKEKNFFGGFLEIKKFFEGGWKLDRGQKTIEYDIK